jgi:hypothetical protein
LLEVSWLVCRKDIYITIFPWFLCTDTTVCVKRSHYTHSVHVFVSHITANLHCWNTCNSRSKYMWNS